MKTSTALVLLAFMISANNCLEDVRQIDLLIPHPTNSSNYFQCAGGNRILMICPLGQSYDVNLRVCRDKDVAASVMFNPEENGDNQFLEEHLVCPQIPMTRDFGTCALYTSCLFGCNYWPHNVGGCIMTCRDLCCDDCPSDCCSCSSYGCK